MINKAFLEGLLHEKYNLTRTIDSQGAINEIMENLDAAVNMGLRNARRNNSTIWRSVKEELPGIGDEVLVYNQLRNTIYNSFLMVNKEWASDKGITHWMEMPAKPEEVNDE